VAIAGALLLPGIADCLTSAGAADAQTMRCCTQVSCAPGHQKQACFATTAPADGSRTAPEGRTSLVAPSVAAYLHAPAEALIVVAFSSAGAADAPQHSPPELYTLHLALLI
jgi:hypothetical protein